MKNLIGFLIVFGLMVLAGVWILHTVEKIITQNAVSISAVENIQ